jgi:predicted nucleic acid-binding protein
MKVLIDSNVILDALLDRQPNAENALKILALSENKVIQGFLSASAVTDIHYIVSRQVKDRKVAIQAIRDLLQSVSVASVGESEIYVALQKNWNDFEDALQYAVADQAEADYIISRNGKDFEEKNIPVIEPELFLSMRVK